MAAIENKRSLRRAQPRKSRAHASTPVQPKKKKKNTPLGFTQSFPMKGRRLENVEFSSSSDYHILHLRFEDKTALTFDIQPGFTLSADYADWKTGNLRPIRRWKPLRSRLQRA
jgi:hypothetical protein